jgi:hypothetical protein
MFNGDVEQQDRQVETRVAVLGTLAEFHREPIPYNLAALVELVKTINPDLLCLDITAEQWQRQEFSDLPPEYADALLPLAYQTDMVVVPIGGDQPMPQAEASGWRGRLIRRLRRWLGWIQRTAPSPDAINQGWRHDLGNVFYNWAHRLAGNRGHHEHIQMLAQAVLNVARQNPGSRVLVVTNIQHCHHLRPQLQLQPGVRVTTYTDL